MNARTHLRVTLCLSLLTGANTALGDGKVFVRGNRQADILQPSQKVYIRWDGSEERLVIQTKYEGPAEEMVWIVPVPAEPAVKKGDPNLFEKLSARTQGSDIEHTLFEYLDRGYMGGSTSRAHPVQWRRRVGDYDVALLKPVGGEDVVQWLNTNGFAVEERAVPILKDYINEKWWMVAARIHPDALTDITRDKLAQGLLDPLEMTFSAARCIYPLRLTGLVAGPVEELIYLEGQTHFQPVGSTKGWEMDVFGGPYRTTSAGSKYPSVVEFATLAAAGKSTKNAVRHLTKLRKVFEPRDMTADLVFEKMDYAALVSLGDASRTGQAATQYGRHGDPAGIPHLLAILSPGELKKSPLPAEAERHPSPWSEAYTWTVRDRLHECKHIRSCIWALGEIAIEHGHNRSVEEALLRCARHNSQPIRMEAYIALIKARSSHVGPIMLERFSQVRDYVEEYRGGGWSFAGWMLRSEADVIADWVEQHGTAREKKAFADLLTNAIGELPTRVMIATTTDEWDCPVLYGWPEWLIARAVGTRDPDVLPVLRALRRKVSDANGVHSCLWKAEAVCGSREAIPMLARRMAEDEARILRERYIYPSDKESRLWGPWRQRNVRYDDLRERILRNRERQPDGLRRILDVPFEIADTIIRATLSGYKLDDWYVLYLLAQIKQTRQEDREMILSIWRKRDPPKQMTAVDVLWLWRDTQTLQTIREQAADAEVRSEVENALTSLGEPTR